MTDENSPISERQSILHTLHNLLHTIGSANDAEDHGYADDARQMRNDSCESIRRLTQAHPFLITQFPTLQKEVESGHIFCFGWSDLAHLVEAQQKEPCPICASLLDQEHAFQKFGAAEHDTHLPAAADQLQLIQDYKPGSNRKRQLRQCPQCGTHFLYTTDYEYLVNGSEDEEFLTRLTPQQALECLNHISASPPV